MIRLHTNLGMIGIELDHDQAPETAANFLRYAENGFFAGTTFHRVIPGFMIQGGGMEPGLREKAAGPPIENEATNGLKNLRGTVSMARTNDPHSASSQFFVNLSDNAFLDHSAPTPQGWGYCVFGRVVDGMKVIDAIAAVPTCTRGMHQDVPVSDVVVESVELID
jgi:peptidyl-prolyl cis-trans isomerase B (cyclophilin B)